MRRLLITIAILAGLGVAVSSYGLWQHYAPLGAAFCNVSETFSCDIVNKSAYSEIAGIPVALIGIVGYAVLAIIAIIAARGARAITPAAEDWREHRETFVTLLILAFLGLVFQGAFTAIELWWIGAYCPICIASQVIILAIVILTFVVYQRVRSFGRPSEIASAAHRMNSSPIIGTLTCPQCGATQQAEIPTSSCQHSYVCNACGKTITAQSSDCCVFCTYGDRKCLMPDTV